MFVYVVDCLPLMILFLSSARCVVGPCSSGLRRSDWRPLCSFSLPELTCTRSPKMWWSWQFSSCRSGVTWALDLHHDRVNDRKERYMYIYIYIYMKVDFHDIFFPLSFAIDLYNVRSCRNSKTMKTHVVKRIRTEQLHQLIIKGQWISWSEKWTRAKTHRGVHPLPVTAYDGKSKTCTGEEADKGKHKASFLFLPKFRQENQKRRCINTQQKIMNESHNYNVVDLTGVLDVLSWLKDAVRCSQLTLFNCTYADARFSQRVVCGLVCDSRKTIILFRIVA